MVKRSVYQSNKELNDQFGGMMNQNESGNRKFSKKMRKLKGRSVKNLNRINDKIM